MIRFRCLVWVLFAAFAPLCGQPSVVAAEIRIPLGNAFPAVNAANIPPDAPLRLYFTSDVAIGSGLIEIRDSADNSVVESIDLSKPAATQTIGGIPNFSYYPVIVSGARATIYPKSGALKYGRSYYVTLAAGAFKSGADVSAASTQPTAWRFSTRTAPPPAAAARLVVAANGSGDFCTLQGAFDFLPDGNSTPRNIQVRDGTYTEILVLNRRNKVTVTGESRSGTVIAYANNERFNFAGNPYAPPDGTTPKAIYHRGVFLVNDSNEFFLTNLTVRNTTPLGGGQAEALILNGPQTTRALVFSVSLFSFQDTLQVNGPAYIRGCRVEGDVDFLWGTGPAFFEDCIFRSTRSNAYFTQVRNSAAHHGFVFLECTFDGAEGVTGNFLSRIQLPRFPASEVVLIDCKLGPAVSPVGWQFQQMPGQPDDTTKVRFWEFGSRGLDGRPIDPSQRLAGSRQLNEATDAKAIADYRNPAFVLGTR